MEATKVDLPSPVDMGMTVSFHKRGPGGTKTHQVASDELRSSKGVKQKSRAKVTVDIFASDNLKEWNLRCGRLKSYIDRVCPPWGRDNRRFLAHPLVAEFEKETAPMLHAIQDSQEAFLAEIPHLRNRFKDEAGSLSDDIHFPEEAELRPKFAVGIDYDVPTGTYDIRLGGLSEEHRSRYEQQVRKSEEDRIDGVVKHVTNIVEQRLTRIVKGMNDYHVDEKGKAHGIFRDSMIGNVREIAGLLEHWNITGNPEIDAVRKRLLTEVCPLDAGDLRKSADKRQKLKGTAEDLLARVGQFGRKKD